MALGMVRLIPFLSEISNIIKGAKSIIIILYEVISERMGKWASLKANMILNCLEVVFWAAVAFLGIQANMKFCVGTNCIVAWAVCGVAGTLRYVLSPREMVSNGD